MSEQQKNHPDHPFAVVPQSAYFEVLAREQRLREENERLKRLLKQRGKDAADAEDLKAWYQQALRAIEGPSDDWLWMEPYRAAGGGYEGLQAIASFALSSVSDGEGE